MRRLLKNKQALINNPISPREIRYVPVKFHIVSKTDGTGGVAEAQVFDMLCTANADFADLEMQFYIKDGEFNYINNDAIHNLILDSNHPQSTINPLIIQNIMNSNRDFAALNVYMVRDIILNANSAGNVLGFYSNDRDWVVMLNNEVRGSSITLTHELGHFFSLPHPFNGWESDPYDPDKHGNPVQANSPGFIPTEKMDGSNCTIAGDRICDTPPDYNFAGISCNWTEEILDPDGTLVNPEEKLTMGYFPCDKDDYFFSEMQKQLMIQDLADSERDYLVTDPNLVTTVLEANTELIFPANDEQLTYYQGLELEWSAVPGATQYLVEIDRLPTFVFQKQSFYVRDANFLELNNLEANKKYYWRVKPYNDYSTCQPFTLAKSFTTGESPTAVQNIDFVSKWVLSPNPLTNSQDINLAFAAEKAFQGNISFFS
ncbi:MAG: hypothetical protein F6K19_44030, partial [Cyanothece sp. SIO1E1]|nr:hypothetical protein [Cyanothece sp. SIO1E1]